jgi:hypothetical protein
MPDLGAGNKDAKLERGFPSLESRWIRKRSEKCQEYYSKLEIDFKAKKLHNQLHNSKVMAVQICFINFYNK